MGSRAGRPTLIADERRRRDAGRPDLRRRVAWLARTSRCAASDVALHRQAAFARRLTDSGVRASAARISMWENGHQAMSLDALRAYEQVLELPPAALQATALGLQRGLTRRGRVSLALPRTEAVDAATTQRLDAVYDNAVRGHCLGHEWFELALHWHCSPSAMTPVPIVRQLASILVDETARSVGVAYATRYQALCLLADHPVYARTVAEMIFEYVGQPGVGPVTDVLAVLGECVAPMAATDLLRLARTHDGQVRVGAVRALSTLALLGHLPQESMTAASQLCQMLHAGSVDDRFLVRPLAHQLAAYGVQRLEPEVPDQGGSPVVSQSVLQAYAEHARTRTGLPSDPVLLRLLHEGHTSQMPQVRHLVALLLLASPYRDALAEHAMTVAVGNPDSLEASSAAWLLTYLAGPHQVVALAAASRHEHQRTRGELLIALAHAAGAPPTLDLDPPGGGSVGSAAIYAAGMSAHPQLRVWAQRAAEPWVREASSWWLRHGPALRED